MLDVTCMRGTRCVHSILSSLPRESKIRTCAIVHILHSIYIYIYVYVDIYKGKEKTKKTRSATNQVKTSTKGKTPSTAKQWLQQTSFVQVTAKRPRATQWVHRWYRESQSTSSHRIECQLCARHIELCQVKLQLFSKSFLRLKCRPRCHAAHSAGPRPARMCHASNASR